MSKQCYHLRYFLVPSLQLSLLVRYSIVARTSKQEGTEGGKRWNGGGDVGETEGRTVRATEVVPGAPVTDQVGRQWLEATIFSEGDEEEQQLTRTDAVERLLERVAEGVIRLHRLLAAYATLALSDTDALPTVERLVGWLAYQANEPKAPQAMLPVLPLGWQVLARHTCGPGQRRTGGSGRGTAMNTQARRRCWPAGARCRSARMIARRARSAHLQQLILLTGR